MNQLKVFTFLFLAFFIWSCGTNHEGHNHDNDDGHHHEQDGHQHDHDGQVSSTGNFGAEVSAEDAMNIQEFLTLMEGTTEIPAKVSGPVAACCQHSGCWMDVDLGEEKLMNVSFLDGEFVIPKDAAGKTAVIEGTAYKELVPVDRLKAYAKEEGKSQEEIDAITEPEWEFTFVASGVILQ